MLHADTSNIIFQLAADFVNNTSRHIFLTGKAGTGKTTFLKHIKEQTKKHTVIIAPTGVAAINAGGVTMHSFFHLPFGPFIPGNSRSFSENMEVSDRHTLLKNVRFNAGKRELLEELELLIIDEISMVRADMLDAMDIILRHCRKKPHLAFGGVQILYIGDMYQLPPVVINNEWDVLQPYYQSPFFFSAQVIAQAPPLYIELKKIYRQNDQQFIDVLNKVRNNQVTAADLALLNNRYQPNFIPAATDRYITLSSHNKKTDAINSIELEKLPGKTIIFNGEVAGDFSEKAFPAELNLQLKEGAQVMFVKNDTGTDRKFFNGKLAVIKTITPDEIVVVPNTGNEELKVEKETWRNLRYTYDKESDRIKEEELGSFTQYPLKLAWAITIHKSQGLTFEKAIIDAGASFAAGQVYVALSRCTSLQGLVLLSKLYPSAIATDQRVIAFAQKEAAAEELQQILQQEQQEFWAGSLVKSFNWSKLVAAMEQFCKIVPGKKLPDSESATALSNILLVKSKEQAAVAERFQQQLLQLSQQVRQNGDISLLTERVNKAMGYFIKSIAGDLLNPLRAHIDSLKHVSKLRKYKSDVEEVIMVVHGQMQKVIKVRYGDLVFCKDPGMYVRYEYVPGAIDAGTIRSKGKPVKGSSQAETFTLYKEGKSIKEIAEMRRLSEGTIGGHLSSFIKTGELDILELLAADKVNIILAVVKEVGEDAVSPVKEMLGDAFSFADIRMVMNHWHWLQRNEVNA